MSDDEQCVVDIVLPMEDAEDRDRWLEAISQKLKIDSSRIHDLRLVKRSIDARQRYIKFQLRVEVGLDKSLPEPESYENVIPRVSAEAKRIIIVGCGPAGLFAGLRCLELGCLPIILERGKDASSRRFDLAPILRKGTVIEDSNYCFGEGGAGTFSDGKLYTRAKKRGPVADIYRILVANGAPSDIMIDAHPHIGSNLLPNVVMSIRKQILDAGGEVHFEAKVSDLICKEKEVQGVVTADGREFVGKGVIMATGHSARDIYHLLHQRELKLEQKPFAMGMRIEHSQELIDHLQYGYPVGSVRPPQLPAASYQLSTTVRDRGVHSFCMCPGGFIVPAATENDEVVVNGMSLSKRDSPFANSGMVVSVEPEDTAPYQAEFGVLAGMAFQRELERAAKLAGGGGQIAPGQRAIDFIEGRDSVDLPPTSYHPGVARARLDEILPPWMVLRLQKGLTWFGKQRGGYISEEALLVGFETRTSSPVRIPRDEATLEHPQLKGLYPCGEGAGYAGGIVSAALDGRRCAEAAAAS